MTLKRILSISTAAFDGYDLTLALEEISLLGVSHVELAFIQGYTDPFGEEIFSPTHAGRIQKLLSETGLLCFAFSAHMNLVSKKSVEIFKRRMEFARQTGARVIVTNAGPGQERKAFMKNMEALSREAESLNLIIGLENPGDGKKNIINSGKDGAMVIREIDSEWVKLNYDFGNLISHLDDRVRPEEDYRDALPYSVHLHLKDVKPDGQGWSFTEIGKGWIDYRFVLKQLKREEPSLPLSLEIPLRVTRAADASPRRRTSPVPIDEIRNILKGSLDFVMGILDEKG
ncbi:MAG TPA: sugar phosphate isomerase/epimerase [Thermodesulfobacteriota bacterium]|nr:sugar phosphate isomerase/epimerase [Thermodesulfobacteriota bacterium]